MQVSGAWLAALAIALHALWPLMANARPKSVALVPVCTVEGVTHYLEIPGGKSPLDESSSARHEHCSLCFLGERLAPPAHAQVPPAERAAASAAPAGEAIVFTAQQLGSIAARAPPGSPLVRSEAQTRENHETAFALGRHRDGAFAAGPR